MYAVGGLILLAVITALTWYVTGGWRDLANAEFERGLIVFTIAILGVAVVLILVLSIVFGGAANGGFIGDLAGRIAGRLMDIPPMQVVATVIGFVTVGLIAWFIFSGAEIFSTPEKARGLITFAVAIVTVAIALILVLYIIFGTGDDEEFGNRFTFGKDVLMVFVGILGTIMGFYYGTTDKVSPKDIPIITASVQNPSATAAIQLETTAFELLIKQDYDGAVKAFDTASKATPTSTNIKNITEIIKFLSDNKALFSATGDRKEIWQKIYCDISNNKRAAGMSKEIIDKFDSGCNTSPSPAANSNRALAANTAQSQ